jgi:hypothetical protein
MPSATVRGSYVSINTIFDPPKFSLDITFKSLLEACNVGHITENSKRQHVSLVSGPTSVWLDKGIIR